MGRQKLKSNAANHKQTSIPIEANSKKEKHQITNKSPIPVELNSKKKDWLGLSTPASRMCPSADYSYP
jgi:hypothetical protein